MGSELTHRRLATGDRPTVEVRRSAWLIECGPFRLARHRTVGRVTGTPPAIRSGLGARALAAAALVSLAVATPIYLSQASAVGGDGRTISQVVPDRVRPATVRTVPPPHRRRPAAAVVRPAAEPDETAALDGDQATAAAWRTGEPQEWAAHGAHGIIVPGAIEREEGMVCRSLSRLTRHPGTADTVARSRQCSVDPGADAAATLP